MSLKQRAVVLAAAIFCVAAGSTRVVAQTTNCVDLYNRVMAVYQTAPLSPEYNQMAATYGASCLAGAAAAAPAYPSYYPQYYAPYYQPPYYPAYSGYAEPFYPYYGYGAPVGVGIALGFGGGFRGGGFNRGGGGRGGGGHRGGGGRHR